MWSYGSEVNCPCVIMYSEIFRSNFTLSKGTFNRNLDVREFEFTNIVYSDILGVQITDPGSSSTLWNQIFTYFIRMVKSEIFWDHYLWRFWKLINIVKYGEFNANLWFSGFCRLWKVRDFGSIISIMMSVILGVQ